MRYIEIAKNSLNIEDEKLKKLEGDLLRIENIIEKHGLSIVDTFEISFVNHIISCIDRINERELLDELDEEMLSEISKKAIDISTEILEKVYRREGLEIDKTEICLLATHIEVALNNK